VEALTESVASLLDQAEHAEDVQILVAADPDDVPTRLAYLRRTRTWIPSERYGYAHLHRYMNGLAIRADGEWLMLWNDDCRMLTQGWDKVIGDEAPGILWPAADYVPDLNTFPVLPAAWVDHLGHVSLDQSADMWWHDIGEMTGVMRKIPVSIHHEHATGDVTANERDAVASVTTFHTPEMDAARAADAEKIRQLACSAA
jgi:hypothetical protein